MFFANASFPRQNNIILDLLIIEMHLHSCLMTVYLYDGLYFMYFELYQVSVIVDVDGFLADRTSFGIQVVLNLKA